VEAPAAIALLQSPSDNVPRPSSKFEILISHVWKWKCANVFKPVKLYCNIKKPLAVTRNLLISIKIHGWHIQESTMVLSPFSLKCTSFGLPSIHQENPYMFFLRISIPGSKKTFNTSVTRFAIWGNIWETVWENQILVSLPSG
jgi:hypothetical protein